MKLLALIGTLCTLSNGKLIDCHSTDGTALHLQPAAESRRVVWTSEDGKRLLVATVAPKIETIDLDAKSWRDVALRITGDAGRGWPADVRIGFAKDVVVTLPAKAVAKLTTISLPAARYTVSFQAEHHVTTTRSFDLASQPRVDAGEVRLRALPVVTGTVVTTRDGHDVPVAGADVSFSGFNPRNVPPHLASADEKGAFRAELPEFSPNAILISQAGLGSKTIVLERREGDVNLGEIRLVAGVPLTVKVIRPPELRTKPLTVTLFREDRAVFEPTRLDAHELAPASEETTFEAVAPAPHFILVQGSEPLERVSIPVKVEEKAASAEVRIEPYTLAGRATFGGDPLDGAKVDFVPRDHTWRTPMPVGADGAFGGTAWQHGTVGGIVIDRPDRIGSGFFVQSPELGADPTVWNIDIKKRTIAGRVYDAETKEPLAKIEVEENAHMLDEQRHDLHLRASLRTDGGGNYTILAARPGKYELTVNRSDYLPKSVTVDVGDEDNSKQADFALERGTAQALVLRWPDGTPIASATVYDGEPAEPGSMPPVYRSDATGTARVRGNTGEVHTLYVMPEEGSIAVVHLPIGGKDAKPVEAVVGRPAGALRIIPVDGEGKPAFGAIVLRYNGELIPPDIVLRRYGATARFEERVLDRLPAGMYEIWLMTQRGVPAQPPAAKVGISGGEERVRIVVPKG